MEKRLPLVSSWKNDPDSLRSEVWGLVSEVWGLRSGVWFPGFSPCMLWSEVSSLRSGVWFLGFSVGNNWKSMEKRLPPASSTEITLTV